MGQTVCTCFSLHQTLIALTKNEGSGEEGFKTQSQRIKLNIRLTSVEIFKMLLLNLNTIKIIQVMMRCFRTDMIADGAEMGSNPISMYKTFITITSVEILKMLLLKLNTMKSTSHRCDVLEQMW